MQAGSVVVQAEGGDEPVSVDLVRRYLGELHERLGITVCDGDLVAEAAAYRPPSGVFLVVRQEGVAVGCGAVRAIAGGAAEIKRMWLAPELRGHGVGARLLAALENEARRLGFRTARLDTRRELTEAVALYQRAGYREVPPYNDNPDADVWLEKAL
jgi:GNAT superfamily N-acetyltransferase